VIDLTAQGQKRKHVKGVEADGDHQVSVVAFDLASIQVACYSITGAHSVGQVEAGSTSCHPKAVRG
jgi:hypothetical protein